MRLGYAPFVLVLGLLAACGESPNAIVKFSGMTPHSSLEKDTRGVSTYCPQCKAEINASDTQCPDQENCGAVFVLAEEFTCPYCVGTGECPTCKIYQQLDSGDCMNCSGVGYLTHAGRTKPCPNCGSKDKEGDGKDPICKGSKKCDYCGGEKKVSGSTVAEMQAKSKKEADKKAEE